MIPLKNIWFNEAMSKLVNVPSFQKRKTGTVGKLKRMNQFKNNKGPVKEPIILKFRNGKYEVIDGRHRVVYGFMRGNKKIIAIIK